MDAETKQVLVSMLEVLKQQMTFLDRQYGWIVAIAESVRADDDIRKRLEQNSQYDQGPQPQLRHIWNTIQNIDALIQQLRKN